MRTAIFLATTLFGLTACSGRSVESGDDGADTGLESESGGYVDEELQMLCMTGCARFETCAPDQLQMLYGDTAACEEDCYALYVDPPGCRAAAEPYATCTANLACEDWPGLLEDPATSPCAAPWEAVAAACDLG